MLLLIFTSSRAQVVEGIATGGTVSPPKPERGWNLHAAYSYAQINNRYEVRSQYKSGINAGIVYRFGQWFAIEGTFTRYQRHTAFSLDNIQAWNADVNAQLSMRIGESDLYFRTVFGMGYVDWKGYYVGPNLNDNYHYYFGKLLNDRFYTANLGCGFSHYFMRQRIEGFGDFRLRIASDRRVLFTICDTQFMFGLRYALHSSGNRMNKNGDAAQNTSASQGSNDSKNGKASRRTNSEKKRRVYKWMKGRK